MKYYELNLAVPNDFSNLNDNEALCSFISNEVIWVTPENASKQLTLSYDKEHQILKIVHHNFSIKLSDFSAYTYQPSHFFIPFQVAIASLVAKNYSINIISKNGTFHPVIIGTNDDSTRLMNAYIVYNQNSIKEIQFTRLNNFIYQVDNQLNDTTTIIYPVTKENLNYIKSSFSFLYPWKQVLNSQYGKLLVPSHHVAGKIYINGKAFRDLASFESTILFYSYELILDDKVKSWAIHPNIFQIPKMLAKIIDGLNKDDKISICQTLVNNDYALEWFIPEIGILVVKCLLTTFKKQYLLADYYRPNSLYYQLAKQNNKTIIYPTNQISSYFSLDNSLSNWALKFLENKYKSKILKSHQLTKEEQNNLATLNEFCHHLPTEEELIRQKFEQEKAHGSWKDYESPEEIFNLKGCTKLQILAIDDFPNQLGFFDLKMYAILINRSNLKEITNAFSVCYQILDQFSLNEYADAWINTMAKYMMELKNKQPDNEKLAALTTHKKHLN